MSGRDQPSKNSALGDGETLGGAHRDPERVGPCRIETRLSTGYSSRVYRAVDTELERTVAVKLLTPPFDADPQFTRTYLHNAEALYRRSLPHVVPVLRVGSAHGAPYVAFEFSDGIDLDTALTREQRLAPTAALRAVLDAASGLMAAHEFGVVHGDVRPRHLLRSRGTTSVTGFGLSPPKKTAQGRMLRGHPAYLAPELAHGGAPTLGSDIYALGCTLFELISGKRPFGHAADDATIACHVHEPFPSWRSVDDRLPIELDRFLATLVHKDPQRRVQDYATLLATGVQLLPLLKRARPDDPCLCVEDGRQQGLRISIPEGELLLGRTPGEGFEIDDGRISRRHAVIRRAGDYLEIEDLGSRNGIRVNGATVRSRQLAPGDHIELGNTLLRVEGPVAVVPQIPAVMPHDSPVRGAFGAVEIAHAPDAQARSNRLDEQDGHVQLKVIVAVSEVLAQDTERSPAVLRRAIQPVAKLLAADAAVVVSLAHDEFVFDARTGAEAQAASCALPALQRAAAGRLSLATTVRVARNDRAHVVLAPVLARDNETMAPLAYVIFLRHQAPLPGHALRTAELCADLLSQRLRQPTTT